MQTPKESEDILKRLIALFGGSEEARYAVEAAYALGRFDGTVETVWSRHSELKEAA